MLCARVQGGRGDDLEHARLRQQRQAVEDELDRQVCCFAALSSALGLGLTCLQRKEMERGREVLAAASAEQADLKRNINELALQRESLMRQMSDVSTRVAVAACAKE